MGDRLGIPGAVSFFVVKYRHIHGDKIRFITEISMLHVGRLVSKVGWTVLSQFAIKMGHSESAISE